MRRPVEHGLRELGADVSAAAGNEDVQDSGLSAPNEDQIAERGAWLPRRDD
jgi:hypothetical protein